MVHQGVRDPGGDLLRDGVVPLDVRGAPSGAAAHLEGHHAGGDGRPSDAAGRAAGGDPAEGGIGAVGTVDTVPALIEAECRRRSRILRVEDSEWLLLRQPRVERRGWKRPKEATPQALKDEIASLASQIKTLQREKGRSAPDTLHAIQRMAELRAQLPTAAKVRKAKPATPTPAPAAPPADAEPRRPVETACDTPLFLRSTCTPVSPCLALRSSCACPLTNRLLEDTLVWHKPAAEVSAYALPAAEGSTCPVCLWNVASHLLLASAAPPAATTALVGRCLAADPTPAVRGGALLLRGMAAECGGDGDAAAASYQEAIACDPSIVADYFGLPESGGELADEGNQPGGAKPGPRKFAIFEDFRIGATASSADPKVTAGAVQRGATLRLLHAVAFAKSPLHAHPPDCPAQQMQHDLHCCVRHFLPPHVVRLLSAHYKEMISHGVVTFGDRRTERYFAYNDPVARLLMAQYTAYIGKLVGFDVKPSYSYMISYRDESELLPHQDREQAEIVVSIQLDMFPECDVWPLFIGAEPQPPKRGDAEKPPAELHRKHVLHDGDAVVFRGRRMIHWREKVSPGTQATMLLIHYVAAGYAGPLKTGMNE